MAIRIRNIDGHTVALNARLTKEQDGDLYLDDAAHHALSTKFGVDFNGMGFMNDGSVADPVIKKIMKAEEWKCICPRGSNDPECLIHKE